MPSYLVTTLGLKQFLEHCFDPFKQLDYVQLVVCELNPITYNPILNSLLALKSERDILERREAVHNLWNKDQQILFGNGVDGAVYLLSLCFSYLNLVGKSVSLSIVGCTQGWHNAVEGDHVYGSKRLLRKLNDLNAYLDKKAFKDGDHAKVMAAILAASAKVTAPISSLALDLQNGSHNLDAASTELLQEVSSRSGMSLPMLERLELKVKISALADGLDETSEVSSVTMVEEMSDCGTELSEDAASIIEPCGLESILMVIAKGAPQLTQFDLTMCGPASDDDAYNAFLNLIHKTIGNAYLQEIALRQGRFDATVLQDFLQSHAIGLKTLILDNVHLQGTGSWRTELASMAENLTLDALELNNLKSAKMCTKFGYQRTKVMCGLCDDGAWASHGFFHGAEKVAEGLEYLVDKETGQYQWLDRLVDGRSKAVEYEEGFDSQD